MFTLQQLKAAHARVSSGEDFPRYVNEIKQLGLVTYEFSVTDGSIVYYGQNGHQINAAAIYEPVQINPIASADALRHTIEIHQQGLTDFITFCGQAAQAGVKKWIIDTRKMLCIYEDLTGNTMVAEPIPDEGHY